MDGQRFDKLTRTLASGSSRRSMLKGLLGLGAAAVSGAIVSDSADARGGSVTRVPTPPPPACPSGQSLCGGSCCPTNRCSNGVCCAAAGQVRCGASTTCCDPGTCNTLDEVCCTTDEDLCYNQTLCCASGTCSRLGNTDYCCPQNNFPCGLDCCASELQCCDNECCEDTHTCLTRVFSPSAIVKEETCCPTDQTCDNQCCDGACYQPLGQTFIPLSFDRSCCPADPAFTFCPGTGAYDGQALCCSGDTPDCCVRDGEPICINRDTQCCVEENCPDSPATCQEGRCPRETLTCDLSEGCDPTSDEPVCCAGNCEQCCEAGDCDGPGDGYWRCIENSCVYCPSLDEFCSDRCGENNTVTFCGNYNCPVDCGTCRSCEGSFCVPSEAGTSCNDSLCAACDGAGNCVEINEGDACADGSGICCSSECRECCRDQDCNDFFEGITEATCSETGACLCGPLPRSEVCRPNDTCGTHYDGCGGEFDCGMCTAYPGSDCFEPAGSRGVCTCYVQCDGKECGPDGCVGTCGTCSPGLTCSETGQCINPCASQPDGAACAGGSCVDESCCAAPRTVCRDQSNVIQSCCDSVDQCLPNGTCCPSGQIRCGGVCIEGCCESSGRGCAQGSICCGGACIPGGECCGDSDCASGICNLDLNRCACGTDDVVCDPDQCQVCTSGVCASRCSAAELCCGGTCISRNNTNCSSCGVGCNIAACESCVNGTCQPQCLGQGQVCSNGTCACQPSLYACGETCIDLTSVCCAVDNAGCSTDACLTCQAGICTLTCGLNQICVGSGGCACASGFGDCGGGRCGLPTTTGFAKPAEGCPVGTFEFIDVCYTPVYCTDDSQCCSNVCSNNLASLHGGSICAGTIG